MTRRLTLLTLLLLSLPGVSGCDVVFVGITHCYDDDGPYLSKSTVIQPQLNQAYSDEIQAFIYHRNDNDYDYRFEVSGRLPPGISHYTDDRTIYFDGAATSPGTYTFRLTVSVDYRYGDYYYYFGYGGLCDTRTSQDYIMTVRTN